jgi:hypothetical protein
LAGWGFQFSTECLPGSIKGDVKRKDFSLRRVPLDKVEGFVKRHST